MKRRDEKEFATALRYRQGIDSAPKVTAKGRGELAKRIIAIAEEEGLSVVEDKDLASVLAHSKLGDEVPPELYRAVAEILAFLYRMNKNIKNTR